MACGHKTIYEVVRIVLPVPDYRQGQALEPGCDVKELVVLAALEQAPGDLARHDDHRDEGTESNPGRLPERLCVVSGDSPVQRSAAIFSPEVDDGAAVD